MRISYVIPTYNAKEGLIHSLRFLSRQVTVNPESDFEVIVADDGSDDGTAEAVRSFQDMLAGSADRRPVLAPGTPLAALPASDASASPAVVRPSMARLDYVFLPRDGKTCRSRVRNVGVKQATGDVIVFLDSGVVVPPHFTRRVIEQYSEPHEPAGHPEHPEHSGRDHPERQSVVLCHYIYGLFASPHDRPDLQQELAPDTLSDIAAQLDEYTEWRDARDGLFSLVDDHVSRLAAPWTMGWTCAMTVPRALFEKMGGFDESFEGWGSEDTDLAYRMYVDGATFCAERAAFALHIPHDSTYSPERAASNTLNRKRLHRKRYLLDTELYPYYPGPYYNLVISRFDNLELTSILPRYRTPLLAHVNAEYLSAARVTPAPDLSARDSSANNLSAHDRPARDLPATELSTRDSSARDLPVEHGSAPQRRTLLVGFDDRTSIRRLATTHLHVHNRSLERRLTEAFPDRRVAYRLGCDTPYPDGWFDVAVASDFYRGLNRTVLTDWLREMCRVSGSLILLYTPGFKSVSHSIDNGPWADIDGLRAIAGQCALSIREEDGLENTHILILTAAKGGRAHEPD